MCLSLCLSLSVSVSVSVSLSVCLSVCKSISCKKMSAKEWEQSILETHMLCITQKLWCLYFTVLSWYRVSLSFSSYFLRGTFNVLVPASIWRWPAQQYSSTFAFKCCRLSYLPIRAISILPDVAIKWVANANYPMQVSSLFSKICWVRQRLTVLYTARAFAAAILNWEWGKLGLLKYFITR